MSIVAYTGLPGSGKSYGTLINVIIPAVESGRRIATNIPLTSDFYARYPDAVVYTASNADFLTDDYWQNPELSGAIIVIDEVWRIWPSGQKSINASDVHKSALAEHRHRVGFDGYTTEICLITQDLSQLAAWVRALVETTYRSVQLSAVGQEKKYRIDIYTGPVTGPVPPESRRIRQIFGSYDDKLFILYQSHTQSSTGDPGVQSRADQRANILRSPLIRYGLPSALIVTIFAIYSAVTNFQSIGKSDQNQQTTPLAISEKLVEKPAQKQTTALSDKWRISGNWNDLYILSGLPGYGFTVSVFDSRCSIDQDGPRCLIDGELVTRFTGIRDHTDIVTPLTRAADLSVERSETDKSAAQI